MRSHYFSEIIKIEAVTKHNVHCLLACWNTARSVLNLQNITVLSSNLQFFQSTFILLMHILCFFNLSGKKLWERRSHDQKTLGTPFPGVPAGTEPCSNPRLFTNHQVSFLWQFYNETTCDIFKFFEGLRTLTRCLEDRLFVSYLKIIKKYNSN
jgi:hypothetical protein